MPNQPKKRDGEAPDPQARGGRRYKNPNSAAGLANLKSWKPGQSGNPSGKSRSLNDIMRLARSHAPEAVEVLRSIMSNEQAADRDRIAACLALLDRGCGRAVVPIYKGGLPDDITGAGGLGDNETSVLLSVAGRDPTGAYRQALRDELARLDAEEAQEKAARHSEVDEAAAAMARGEEVSPLMRMLVQVKNETG
jgi:hypothetical protein